ncbi:MAG: ABC transporter permease [Dehalococcoidia bacterium]|nr:ABC transporter permease [Dehalococcoidia bacterium]
MTVVVTSPRAPSWLGELWGYREFLRNLVVRDLKVRYRNSFLGFLWSLLNPLLMMLVFTIVFGILLGQQSEAYPIFILVALLPWNFTSSSVLGAVNSIVGNGHLVKRVYFPREILPASLVVSNLVNFTLALPMLFLLKVALGSPVSGYVALLPLVLIMQTIFLMGVAFIVSSVNVYFRDTEVIVDVFMLAWFFLSPIVYRIEQLSPENAEWLYRLNPMASLISTYRLILYNNAPPDPLFLARTAFTCVVVLVIGYLVFRRLAPGFGEEV